MSEVENKKRRTHNGEEGVSKIRKSEWVEYYDSETLKSYFYNTSTKETVWELPGNSSLLGTVDTEPEKEPQPAENPVVVVEEVSSHLLAKNRAEEEAARSAAIARQIANQPESDKDTSAVVRSLPLPPGLAALPDKLKIFMRHDRPPSASEMGRPARVQARPEDFKSVSYVQGQEEFNIWYGKFASDRLGEGGRREKIPAPTHCNIFRDAGFTRADMSPHLGKNPVCLYFAKGCCSWGHECTYFHHVPTRQESDQLDLMRDIFGRERHAQQRDDMEGVGSFNSTSRTLFVGDYKVDRIDGNFVSKIETLILAHFAVYGPIEDIRVIPNRNFAFVTFCYRAAAEFAKVAMANYKLTDVPNEVLTVKWAQGNRNPVNQARVAAREYDDARRIVMERMRQIAILEEEHQQLSSATAKAQIQNETPTNSAIPVAFDTEPANNPTKDSD